MTIIDDKTAPPPVRSRAKSRVRILSRAEFLAKLRKDDPAADAETIRQRYEIACRAGIEDEQTLELVMPYVIEGLRRDVKDPRPEPKRRAAKAEIQQRVTAALQRGIEDRIEAEATIRLLEHITPNGLKLRDCTGAMCRNLGGWYGEISKRLNPRDHVEHHLDEIELHAIAKRWRILDPAR